MTSHCWCFRDTTDTQLTL